MQQNHFGRHVGSDPASGLSCPDAVKLAAAYGIPSQRVTCQKKLPEKLDVALAAQGPFLCDILMPADQPLIPRVSSARTPEGGIVAKPLEDLYPFLDREEFLENMHIDPVQP